MTINPEIRPDQVTNDPIVNEVINIIVNRHLQGMEKFGKTMDSNDRPLDEWIAETIEELIEYYTERLLDTDTENSILFALDEGISVEMIAEFVSTSGTMNGRHSLDLAFLINPFIRELVRYIGETANISYVDSYSEREKKKEVPYRQMREVVKEVFNEMPETTMIQPKEPSPKGLMARLSKEEE